MKTTKEKHAELKKLGKKNRAALYDMLKLAVEIMDDPAYCEEYGGSTALQDHLESTDFIHFGGKPSLANMLMAYRKNPLKTTWDEYQHNIHAMIELARPAKQTADSEVRINWKARAKELEVQLEMLRHELAELRKRHEDALTKIGKLSRAVEFAS